MTTLFRLFPALLLSVFSMAQQSEGARLLFKNAAAKLSAADQEAIFKQTGFLLSADKKQFIAGKDGADYPFDAQVFATDLNKDGTEEIFVVFGNTYTSGNAGSSVALYIKSGGGYKMNLGFPGLAPDVLATGSGGYPDLLIGGPGMQFPVWRWSGKAYAFYKEVSNAAYGRLKKTDLETASKNYHAALPKQ